MRGVLEILSLVVVVGSLFCVEGQPYRFIIYHSYTSVVIIVPIALIITVTI